MLEKPAGNAEDYWILTRQLSSSFAPTGEELTAMLACSSGGGGE